MARNKIEDLNNHLFAALERLNDEDMEGDKLTEEIERAKAIAHIGSKVIDAMKVQSDLFQSMIENGYRPQVPEQFKNMLEEKNINS
ncbi:MAG: hypothetical protein LBD80_09305 [Tannerella sp.]|jgi:UDP-N-acetylglucosamine 2-epimerase|nr:hypothetical protein [Tannerella sp.]